MYIGLQVPRNILIEKIFFIILKKKIYMAATKCSHNSFISEEQKTVQ